jgi:two-component system, chemotaxis family, CheB/CheR fusion protein
VGVGASAGGLEACTELLDAMPAEPGMAIVIVQHLSPNSESMMSEILGRHTTMPVTEITGDEQVEPNHVYVIRPARTLTIANGILSLQETTEPHWQQHPIDLFLRTLAEDRRELSAAVILSGTGSNGSLGIRDIKEHGGIVLVQTPETAKFDGMPQNAIATTIADFVEAPGELARVLVEYFQHTPLLTVSQRTKDEEELRRLTDLLNLVRQESGQDFLHYKKSMLFRRVYRRMGLHHLDDINEYSKLMTSDSEELQALIRDLLISVTGFFRDPEAWKTLRKDIIRPMVQNHNPENAFRVWVPACATGEEAYSLAMILAEELEAARKHVDIKIFATDMSDNNLSTAREALYSSAMLVEVPANQLKRHFDPIEGFYRLKKPLREMVVFARHDLLQDPPFSKMNLVSCRNLLIYFETEAQRRIIRLLHFALVDRGVLFLGNAETLGREDDLFEVLSAKWRIFKRVGPTRYDRLSLPVRRDEHHTARIVEESPKQRRALSSLVESVLVERFAPASVLVDGKGRVLYYHGNTEPYLIHPQGFTTNDVLSLAREGLRGKLRAAMHRAEEQKQTTVVSGGWVLHSGKRISVRITVHPVPAETFKLGHMLISFENEPGPAAQENAAVLEVGEAQAELERMLHAEIKTMRDELQSTIEQLESSNEELKASNEEATSTNEELQSTNEELETAKEELQSLNEELHTVNAQLQSKVEELEQNSNDLTNLLAGSDIATLFLDLDLRIKWFSPAVAHLVEVIPGDIGRPIGSFAYKFSDDHFIEDCRKVLEKLTPLENEVRGDDDRWFIRRILPYRTQDNRINGVVVRFIDVTERKQTEEQLRQQGFTQSVVDSIREPLVVLDSTLKVHSANEAFYDTYELSPAKAVGQRLDRIGKREFAIPRLHKLLEQVREKRIPVVDEEIAQVVPELGERSILVDARPLEHFDFIVVSVRDVTEFKHRERAVSEFYERRRLASELHDYLAQQLVVSQMKLHALGKHIESAEAKTIANELFNIVTDSLRYTRTLIAELNPPVLFDSGIVAAAQWLAERMQQHQLTVTVSESGTPHVFSKPVAAQLYQAIRELLFNVLKHAGTDSAECRFHWSDDALRVEVEDRGAGFDPAKLAHPSVHEVHFGLETIEEKMHALKGSFVICTAPGAGCTVRITLPYESGTSRASNNLCRVMLVDDHQLVRLGIRNLLESHPGVLVVGEAAEGAEALSAMDTMHPDLVIMDWNMPGMSGKDTTLKIREQYPAVFVVGCTVHDDPDTHRSFREAGASAVLSKDRLSEELFKTIDELCGIDRLVPPESASNQVQ